LSNWRGYANFSKVALDKKRLSQVERGGTGMKNVVSIDWVKKNLDNPDVRIVDCRFTLGRPAVGFGEYQRGHIPGAVYLDLEQDLSGPKGAGGRHPLPDVLTLAEKLGELGMDESVQVVAYDDEGGTMASRLWWLLKYLGQGEAFIMDGGFSGWKEKGHPVTTTVPKADPKTFHANVHPDMLVTMQEVREKMAGDDTILIDSRDATRYRGIEEPIDPVAGHIPGAINHFWKETLDEKGRWKPVKEQELRFQDIDRDKEIIVYCGSGVSACPNILALKEAGFQRVKLYPGSWSEWISYPENPIATEEKDQP
jgi:thiosulfate/3-mercaptopyruvate sulfurtransferase